MNKKNKNIITIVLIVALIASMIFTMFYAKNNVKVTNNGNQPPNNMTQPSNNNSNQPPEKPDDNINNNQSNDNKSTTEESKNFTVTDNQNNEQENKDQQPMEKPDNTPPDMKNSTTNLPTCYFIIFGIESLLLSILVVHLVMSKLNQKSIKETYYNKDKIIILILITILSTSLLTFIDLKLTKKYFLNNNSTKANLTFNNNKNNKASYSSSKELKDNENITEGEYTSTTKDQNSISASKVTASLSGITVSKTGDSDGGDNTSFYGTNSAIIARNGAKLTINNIKVTTDATGANGVFSYGGSATTNNSSSDGTTLTISDSVITTSKDNSGGIMTTGGGVLNANNLTINTAGTSSAAIRTDRGGGTVSVDKGTYTTTGKGSPAIYSTANVSVKNAKLISKASEGVVIEGKNSVTLDNVELIDTNNTLNGQSTTYKNIFLYQSMSGDAANGEAKFTAKDSTITTNKGDSFYVTNTNATISLSNNTIINNDKTGNFLRIQKDSWGNNGSNGGIVNLILDNQKISGDIVVDSISTLEMNLTNQSSYKGAINSDNTAKKIKLSLDSTSSITLTKDTYITELNNKDKTNSNINFNGYKLFVNGKAI